MNFSESLGIALQHLHTNKFRSFLTMLGIIIGIASVIAVLSIGEGGRLRIDDELNKLGINRVGIYAVKPIAFGQMPINLVDAQVLKDHIKSIIDISTIVSRSLYIEYDGKQETVELVGTDHTRVKVEEIKLEKGKFLSSSDIRYARKVIILNTHGAQSLFGSQNPLGKKVKVQEQSFVVIGVEKPLSGPIVDQSIKNRAYIPITVFQTINRSKWVQEITMTLSDPKKIKQTATQAISMLEQRHHLQHGYKSYNMVKEIELAQKIMSIFTLVIGSIAAVSLLVGGIGVMNIMLATVTERTREIGIRKAIGARNSQILSQFLMESLMICLFGGLLGVCAGIVMTYIAAWVIQIPPVISARNILLSTLFAAVIGLFFGLYPARKAALLDPIEALRNE